MKPHHLVTIRMGASHNDITIQGEVDPIPIPHGGDPRWERKAHLEAQHQASLMASDLCSALGIGKAKPKRKRPRKRNRKAQEASSND